MFLHPLVDRPTGQFTPFNLHFQEIFFVSWRPGAHPDYSDIAFQSPFSGDFLCFQAYRALDPVIPGSFNLHFQEIFFVSQPGGGATIDKNTNLSISIFRRFSLFPPDTIVGVSYILKHFQSPFSGDFLCFRVLTDGDTFNENIAFNLHFQEIFFVSEVVSDGRDVLKRGQLSISIFRRFSLFRDKRG